MPSDTKHLRIRSTQGRLKFRVLQKPQVGKSFIGLEQENSRLNFHTLISLFLVFYSSFCRSSSLMLIMYFLQGISRVSFTLKYESTVPTHLIHVDRLLSIGSSINYQVTYLYLNIAACRFILS